jgi:hypothetical protein
MIHLSVPGGRGLSGLIKNAHPLEYRMDPKPFIDRADKKRVSIYRKSLAEYRKLTDPPRTLEHAYANLLNLTSHSVITASKVFPAKGSQAGLRSSYKDGWSPTAMALKAQRIAITQILGHLQGTKGRTIWRTLHEQSLGILKIVNAWVKAVLKLKWIPPDTGWKVMDATIYGPSYWKTLDTMTTATFCIERLDELSSKLHGKQRQKLRENINNAVKIRERMVQEGKLKQYNKAVLR